MKIKKSLLYVSVVSLISVPIINTTVAFAEYEETIIEKGSLVNEDINNENNNFSNNEIETNVYYDEKINTDNDALSINEIETTFCYCDEKIIENEIKAKDFKNNSTIENFIDENRDNKIIPNESVISEINVYHSFNENNTNEKNIILFYC